MKKILFCLIIIVGLTSFKTVGVRTAHLTCKSESGRTLFNAELEDIDTRLTKAELIIDGDKLNFADEVNSSIIFDSKNGVFTVSIESKSQLKKDFSKFKYLKFWAIPKSFKTIFENSDNGKYEFRAKMYSTEPRKGKDSSTPEIELNCELEYEI
jgi:hypothetical protein